MPTLVWPKKAFLDPKPVTLVDEALVYPGGYGYPDHTPGNRLIWGDNLQVMNSLLQDHEGRIDLIYADPPFFTNRRYTARIGRGEDSRHPEKWSLATGYTDHWQEMDDYLDFLYTRLALMRRLLSPHGTLYLHLDWHADAAARLLLDELFGRMNLLNEIIWIYHGPSPIKRAFNRKHDTILVYAKSDQYIFNVDQVREPYHPNTVKTFASSPKAGFGKVPNLERGKVPEDWWYFPVVARLHNERTGYPTQKPEALLERILLASSNPDSLVADFFSGSGTFPLVAARNGRAFIACDSAWRAVHTTRIRLLGQKTPYRLQRDTELSIPVLRKTLPIHHSGRDIRLEETADIDYWEVDPAWEGSLYKSARQAFRPRRAGGLPQVLTLPVDITNPRLRVVTIDGEQLEF